MFYYQNERGVARVFFNGFFYRLNNKAAAKIHWSCDRRSSSKCRASLTTSPKSPYTATLCKSEHNHDIDAYSKTEKFTLMKMADIAKIYESYFNTI